MGVVMDNLEERQQLASKISLISKKLGALPADGENKFSHFNYITYEQIEGKLRELEEEIGIQIYPEIVSFSEDNIKTSNDKDAIRTTLVMQFYITDTKTGWSECYSWAGADQDTGGKSFGQTITECCKRFKMKLYKVSSKGEIDPDSKTTDGKIKTGSQKKQPQPQKKREKPDDKVWTKLKEAFDVVGAEVYQQALKECGLDDNPYTVKEGQAVLIAIEVIANA